MEILIRDTPEAVAQTAADIVATYVQPGAVIGLATGSTPVATYRELISRYNSGELSFSGVKAFCLDEYIGIPREHEQSYYRFIRDEFTAHVDFADDAVHSPDGLDPRPWEAAERYEQAIVSSGGIEIQILGIGTNGHIGFNEPASPLRARTRVEVLHPQTIADNSRFFNSVEDVPTHAITQGLGTIQDAGHALVLATGAGKAQAVHDMVEGPITSHVPASSLQLHPHVTVLVDAQAASLLRDRAYYEHMEAHRPSWLGVDGRPRA